MIMQHKRLSTTVLIPLHVLIGWVRMKPVRLAAYTAQLRKLGQAFLANNKEKT
jgi:hypothetical protein